MKRYIHIIGFIFIIIVSAGVSLFYIYPQFTGSNQTEVETSTNSNTKDYSNIVITLERTACFGTCPVYNLTIHGDGRVIYEGDNFVEVEGEQTYQISPDKVRELVDKFYEIDYFSLDERYDASVTDLPTTITSITIDGETKDVVNYYGAPEKLRELESKIDEIANSDKWVEGE